MEAGVAFCEKWTNEIENTPQKKVIAHVFVVVRLRHLRVKFGIEQWKLLVFCLLIILSVFAAVICQTTLPVQDSYLTIEATIWGVVPSHYTVISDVQIQNFIRNASQYGYFVMPPPNISPPAFSYARSWAESLLKNASSTDVIMVTKINEAYYTVRVLGWDQTRSIYPSIIFQAILVVTALSWVLFFFFLSRHNSHEEPEALP